MECMKLTYHDGLLRVIAAVEDDTEQVVLYCEDKKEKTSLKHSSLKTQYVLEPCMSISLQCMAPVHWTRLHLHTQ